MSKPPTAPLIEAVESAAVLDGPGKAIAKQVRSVTGSATALKETLSGTWLGHALHPLMTDVVIGSFVSATILDALGGEDDDVAKLIAVGIAAYPATAATGVNDWADGEPADDATRRVGLVHAAVNASALGLYAASLAARRRGSRGRGRLLGFAGAAALGAGGFLGGHLSFVRGQGVNQTAFDEGPSEWTRAAAADDVVSGSPLRVVVDDTPVLLVRAGADSFHALHDRCNHRGCSLAEFGETDEGSIICKCHGSKFRLSDGALEQGPATVDQPAYETRVRDGDVEVKLAR
jgi:nitrite reductase/ring-hydroxylating ferredoxin subunit